MKSFSVNFIYIASGREDSLHIEAESREDAEEKTRKWAKEAIKIIPDDINPEAANQ